MANPRWKEWTEPDKLILLQGWARDGLTNEQIAKNIGITTKTLYEWLRDKKTEEKCYICDALKKGKEVADYEVENALFKSACGYYAEEEVLERDPDTGLMVVAKRTRKYIPPSNTAQIFWLKNRKQDSWKDKREEVQDIKNEVKVLFDKRLDDYAD